MLLFLYAALLAVGFGVSSSNARPLLPSYDVGSPTFFSTTWVDPINGVDSDARGGTRGQALRTLAAAWRRIPTGPNALVGGGYRINLVAGDYDEESIPNYWEDRIGSYTSPIVLHAVDGVGTVRLLHNVNVYGCRYLYFIGIVIRGGGGDILHFTESSHILLRNVTVASTVVVPTNGGTASIPSQDVQESLKMNQCQYVYIEYCDFSGAWDNAVDFVAIQHGHVVGSKVHIAGDWAMYVKGGSANLTIRGNEFYDAGTGGFTAGQGTGFEWMTPPWLQYEAYDITFADNVIHDTWGAGIGVNGGMNILMANNTMYRVGSRSHVIEVGFGSRSCDGDIARCAQYLSLGGWGPSSTGWEASIDIPNKNVTIVNNVVMNPSGYKSMWEHFSIPGSHNTPFHSPARADDGLQILGNIIWNGPVDHSLGLSSPLADIVLRDNQINTFCPALVDPRNGDYRVVPGATCASMTARPTTKSTTRKPTTMTPQTQKPTSSKPSSSKPTTAKPVAPPPTTSKPTSSKPTPKPVAPTTTRRPTLSPTRLPSRSPTKSPTRSSTRSPSKSPTQTNRPTPRPTTSKPTTKKPSTPYPLTGKPTTRNPAPTGGIHLNDYLIYRGAFRLSGDGNDYAIGTLAYNSKRHSLFVAGHAHYNSIAEYPIPDSSLLNPAISAVTNLPKTGPALQPYTAVMDLVSRNNNNPDNLDRITGLLYDSNTGALVVNAEVWYDTVGATRTTGLVANATNMQSTTIRGFAKLAGAAQSAGYMGVIPQSLRSDFGDKTYYSGWSSVYSVISRYSVGPSCWTISSNSFVADMVNACNNTNPANCKNHNIPTTARMNFPYGNCLPNGDTNCWEMEDQGTPGPFPPASPIWNALSRAMYAFFLPSQRLYVAIGSTAGLESGIGYKAVQNNGIECPGQCQYDVSDTYNYFWIFRVDDMINAGNVWDPRPVAYGKWSIPFDGNGKHVIIGATLNVDQTILYVALEGAGKEAEFDYPPLIVQFEVKQK